ncbi:hypothetical protein SBA5_360008 [Candidatus Sulfotelmatomonas gaucii]|uniref:Uncharacterized protein n=1 Tax=Candidatus Sulfuritelmatomonas gaucii TaxID=2043161 RepID=A0A2N9LHN6_9BACT|nr:hypothetical protein SBA5_360008 [Candidatus Sulfotelmatomonas gaucii]
MRTISAEFLSYWVTCRDSVLH